MFIKIGKIEARGKIYSRYEFESFEDLEQYFVAEILGRTDIRSKVIGKVLIWGKEQK
jgi:hypothetical protein